METNHKHRTYRTVERPYTRCQTPARCQPKSHGGVEIVEHCRCGAQRNTNSNAGAIERTPWIPANEDSATYLAYVERHG